MTRYNTGTPHLTGEELNLLAEGLASSGLAVARTHLIGCAACSARLEALEHLLVRAHNAPRAVQPPADFWPEIRMQIARDGMVQGRKAGVLVGWRNHTSSWSRRVSPALVATAAVALLGTGIVTTFAWNARPYPGGASTPAPASVTTSNTGRMAAVPIATPVTDSEPDAPGIRAASLPAVTMQAADEQTDQTEQDLLAELEMRRHDMRPEATAEIQADLKVVDSAIGELKQAMAHDPSNPVLRQLLASSYEHKAALLRQTKNAS